MRGAKPWADEHIEQLRALASEGVYTANEIAVKMDCTRNMVIGKCYREGIELLPASQAMMRVWRTK